ncbi:uncharacterized protein LOC143587658 [Bidens hawaiensis]|uniref:uncharacterized protein LOC143587658 n=1 Tax=Bidens hawaiensis TaxID=980011 RepID=UPI00404953FA
MSQDAELSKKEAEAKLADLLKAISIKDLLLKKKDKEISDLKASFESEKNEFLEDAKKCAAASILESMIKMFEEVQAKGHVMESWNSGAWKKKLKVLRGESIEEDATAGTSEVIKDDGTGEGAKEIKAGETKELENKEGNDAEGGQA